MTDHTDHQDAAQPPLWIGDDYSRVVHRLESDGDHPPRPLCDADRFDPDTVREVRLEDMPCRECVARLLDSGRDLGLPLHVCLGCGRLHRVDKVDWIIEPHREQMAVPSPECRGAGRRPRKFDGRDDVRADALAGHDGTRRNLAARRDRCLEAMTKGQSMPTVLDHAEEIVRLETMLTYWNEVVDSGDYLPTVRLALIKSMGRRTGHTGMDAVVDQARIEGSQEWLAAVRWRLVPILGLPLSPGHRPTAASELFEVLSVL